MSDSNEIDLSGSLEDILKRHVRKRVAKAKAKKLLEDSFKPLYVLELVESIVKEYPNSETEIEGNKLTFIDFEDTRKTFHLKRSTDEFYYFQAFLGHYDRESVIHVYDIDIPRDGDRLNQRTLMVAQLLGVNSSCSVWSKVEEIYNLHDSLLIDELKG